MALEKFILRLEKKISWKLLKHFKNTLVKRSSCLVEPVRRAAFAVLYLGIQRAKPMRRGGYFSVRDRQVVHTYSCLNRVREVFGEQNPSEVHLARSVPSRRPAVNSAALSFRGRKSFTENPSSDVSSASWLIP